MYKLSDAGLITKPGVDGAHLSEPSHSVLAKAVAGLIR